MVGVPSRFGASAGGGGPSATYATNTALFLKKFSGEIIRRFEQINVMREIVTSRTITSGKSAQFPIMGAATTGLHMPGQNIIEAPLTQTIQAHERVINTDHTLVAPVLVSSWDEAVNHYDVRTPYAEELSRTISVTLDKMLLQLTCLAARASGLAGHPAGTQYNVAGMSTNVGTLIDYVFRAAQKLDENDVPKEGRYLALRPAQYYQLIKDPAVTVVMIDSDSFLKITANTGFTGAASNFAGGLQQDRPQLDSRYNNDNASFARGVIHQLAGFTILKTNHLPSTNIATSDTLFGNNSGGNESGLSSSGNVYYGDFRETTAVAFQKQAVGMVKLRDLSIEQEYKLEYLATLVVAKMICGAGILRPDCAVELLDDSLV